MCHFQTLIEQVVFQALILNDHRTKWSLCTWNMEIDWVGLWELWVEVDFMASVMAYYILAKAVLMHKPQGKKQGTIIIYFCWEHFGVSLGALLPLYHHIRGIGKFTGRIYYFILTGKLVLSPYRQRKRLSSDEISSELWSEDFKYQNTYMFASKYPCSVSIVQQASEMLKIRNFLRTSSILQVGNSTPNFMWLATVKKYSMSLPSFQPLFCKVCIEHKWSWCLDLNCISKISYICLWHSKVSKRKKKLFWFWAFG